MNIFNQKMKDIGARRWEDLTPADIQEITAAWLTLHADELLDEITYSVDDAALLSALALGSDAATGAVIRLAMDISVKREAADFFQMRKEWFDNWPMDSFTGKHRDYAVPYQGAP